MKAGLLLGMALCAMPAGTALSACNEPERRQFDFWLGAWQVDGAQGPAGHNRIESIEDGCALLEHWRGATGGSGILITSTTMNMCGTEMPEGRAHTSSRPDVPLKKAAATRSH